MSFEITFLGTGASTGVPEIACSCEVCSSNDPKNKRLRTSICISINGKNIIIDTTTDFRTQILDNKIKSLDALIYTHHHADHIMGLADIRPFNFKQKSSIPIYISKETLDNLKLCFSFLFNIPEHLKQYNPQIDTFLIEDEFELFGLEFTPFVVKHSKMDVLAFRFENTAYVTDVNFIPENCYDHLENLDLLILDAFRFEKHISHFSLDEAVEIAQKISAKKTLLTHCGHDFDYKKINDSLPENISLAFDGQKIIPSEL